MLFHNRYIAPVGPINAPILFIGEAGGEHEHEQGEPFVGASGDLLMACLARHGISRGDVRLDNLFPYRPVNNKLEPILNTPEFRESLTALAKRIHEQQPNVIVPLGKLPLQFITGMIGIKKWRGSIIPFLGNKELKCIPTYHPAAVLRKRELYPIFDIDIKRIIGDSTHKRFDYPQYTFHILPRGLDQEELVERLCAAEFLTCDIETIKGTARIICVGFGLSATEAVVFGEHDTRAIQRVLESNSKKIFQNGTFDTTVLKANGHRVYDPFGEQEQRPYYWDTLVAHHVIAPELPRSLEFLTSIYTRQPYYKTVGRGNIPDDEKGWSDKVDKQSLYEYNAKDCCCTYAAWKAEEEVIQRHKPYRDTFAFEMESLQVASHISDSGMFIDMERRELLENVLLNKWNRKQAVLNTLSGGVTNVRSPKLKDLLYGKDRLGLPIRRNRDGTITTDEDAIVSLIGYCKDHVESVSTDVAKLRWETKLAICKFILEIRGYRQLLSVYLRTHRKKQSRFSADGRLRSTYKVAGTDTGRWSSSKYFDGTGYNAQTLPRDPIEISEMELKAATKELLDELDNEPDEEEDEGEEE